MERKYYVIYDFANQPVYRPYYDCDEVDRRLADRDAEIVDLRARLDAEASHRLSLCADNERFLAEIERLREQHRLAHLDWAAESVKTLELEAEIERLRADLVWAVRMSVHIELSNLQSGLDVVFTGSHRTVYDGTPESICRAVREARDGVR